MQLIRYIFIVIFLLFTACTSKRQLSSPPPQEGISLEWPVHDSAPPPQQAPARTDALLPATATTEETIFYNIASGKLGYALNGTENRALISEVIEWLGTPYKYGGNTKQGSDCSGFVNYIYLSVYNKNLERSSINIARRTRKIDRQHLKEGDLVFFKINQQPVSHVGIYISNNKFVHASTSRGVIISDMDEEYYRRRFVFGGRID